MYGYTCRHLRLRLLRVVVSEAIEIVLHFCAPLMAVLSGARCVLAYDVRSRNRRQSTLFAVTVEFWARAFFFRYSHTLICY